ncbi:hypothetical protein ABIB82_003426 [Bradyrhizobium sp. i1.8.4]
MIIAAITGAARNYLINRTDTRRRFSELSQSTESTGCKAGGFFVVDCAVNTLATRFD